MKKRLLDWQEECIRRWEANSFRGIANVVTGAGKTIMAAAAIDHLSMQLGEPIRVKIIVPKTFLMYQWHSTLLEQLNVPREDIGFYSGTYKSQAASAKFMIYVVNSARYTLARNIVEDAKLGNKILLIADECHHYGSSENSRIFAYLGNLPKNAEVYTLGLSATPWCKNYNEVLAPALGDEIYHFGFSSAIKADIISEFTLFNIRVNFNDDESFEYDDLSHQLGLALFKLYEIYPGLHGKKGENFFASLEMIIRHSDDDVASLAKTVLFLSIQRKELVYQASNRINCVVQLIERVRKTAKIIIFGERIDSAEDIFRRLSQRWPNEIGIYHSKIPKETGKFTLRQFEDKEIRILVSCKTLDEGLNISETDVGIIVSSTSSKRQRVQRLGRVLRKKPGGRKASFYYLYIGGTSEEEELLKELTSSTLDRLVNRINLEFDEQLNKFTNAQYEKRVSSALEYIIKKGCTEEEMKEFIRNTELGAITEDWLLPEDECLLKFNAAKTKAERNYYITMLILCRCL